MSLLTNPFFQIGSGLLARSGPSLTPINPYGGINDGLMAVQAARQDEQRAQYLQMQKQEMERKLARQQQMDAYAATLTDPTARAFPDIAAQQELQARYARPEPVKSVKVMTAAEAGYNALPPESLVEVQYEDGVAGDVAPWNPPKPAAPPAAPEGTMWRDPANLQAGVMPIPGYVDTRNQLTRYQQELLALQRANLERQTKADEVKAEQGDKKPLTETQSKAANFLTSAIQAEQEMAKITGTGYDPAESWSATWDAAARALPFGLGKSAQSTKGQQYENAAKNWVAAVVYGRSGAQITPGEWDIAKQTYIPSPSDSPEVAEQKKRNRETAMKGLAAQAGPGAPPMGAGVGTEDGWTIEVE